jgi:hypothetical protein
MHRRRFLFWASFGVFSLGEKFRIGGLDSLAAAMLDGGPSSTPAAQSTSPAGEPTHWRAAHNETWLWYERETFRNGRWFVTGLTQPIHRETGEPYTEQTGYLDASLVPKELRVWEADPEAADGDDPNAKPGEHLASAARRARHGRPPSKWLRSLNTDELRIWLATLDVPEATVSGMTYFTHLTRDHFFDADKVRDLAEPDQAKLHAAAHHGY